jgi:hypothetical protein
MTAPPPPGDNLDFRPSASFQERTQSAPQVVEAVRSELRNHPNAGVLICAGIKELAVRAGGASFVVIFRRRANAINLVHIFAEGEERLLDAKRREINERCLKGEFP